MRDKLFSEISIFIVLFLVVVFAVSYNLTLTEVQKEKASNSTPRVLSVNKNKVTDNSTNETSPKAITSGEAFFIIQNIISEAYPNSKIISCTGGSTNSNYSDGLLPNWTCEFYSQNGGFDSKVEWSEGNSEILTPHQFWYVEDTTINPNDRTFYNPLEFIDSKFVYTQLIFSGYSPEKEYYELSIGSYELKNVWEANVYAKNGDGSYSDTYLRKVIFDADTGKMIDII